MPPGRLDLWLGTTRAERASAFDLIVFSQHQIAFDCIRTAFGHRLAWCPNARPHVLTLPALVYNTTWPVHQYMTVLWSSRPKNKLVLTFLAVKIATLKNGDTRYFYLVYTSWDPYRGGVLKPGNHDVVRRKCLVKKVIRTESPPRAFVFILLSRLFFLFIVACVVHFYISS